MSTATIDYFGPFRLLNIVHTGQTSQVWQAYRDDLRQFFAVKTLLGSFREDREHVQFLKWEEMVAGKIEHERIIKVHSFAVERGNPYLAMEWFPAPNMKQQLRPGPDAIAHIIPRMFVEAAEAVVAFNKYGWVHRDVKPDNFLVTDEGEVKLIDFALAQRVKKGIGKILSPKSKVQGTRSYMSPEQIRGKALDERTDLYGLACTFFEALSGRPPYTGVTADDLLMHHLKSPVPSLKAQNRKVTPEFTELIQIAMAKKASSRHDSVEEFLEQLRSVRVFERTPTPPQTAKKREH